MRRTNRALGLAAALVISATSGCGTTDDPAETSSPPDATAPSSPDETATTSSPVPTEVEPVDAGQEAAADAVVEFWVMVD